MLRSTRAWSRPAALGDIRSDRKKLWRAESAAEVIGPVDSGERIMAKKGASSVVNGISRRSVDDKHKVKASTRH